MKMNVAGATGRAAVKTLGHHCPPHPIPPNRPNHVPDRASLSCPLPVHLLGGDHCSNGVLGSGCSCTFSTQSAAAKGTADFCTNSAAAAAVPSEKQLADDQCLPLLLAPFGEQGGSCCSPSCCWVVRCHCAVACLWVSG